MSELYKAIPGSPITYLAADISANQTTISVADDSALPDAPNICTIGYGENIETIRYEAKSNGVLQNVTRGIEGTPRAWKAGTEVARFYTAYEHNAIVETIESHLADYASLSTDVETIKSDLADYASLFTDVETIKSHFADGDLFVNSVHIGSMVYEATGLRRGNRTVRLQTDTTVFAIYGEGNLVFAVRQDGSKIGGLVIKDNKKYYMSPVDSPRMLIQDIITDVKLTGEQQEVYLDPDFANIIDGYAVICGGNVEIIEKHKKYFVVKGTGICDFLIVGNRYDYKDKYWFPMKDEDAEDI